MNAIFRKKLCEILQKKSPKRAVSHVSCLYELIVLVNINNNNKCMHKSVPSRYISRVQYKNSTSFVLNQNDIVVLN